MNVHRVLSTTEHKFDALVRIYTEAHPATELKTVDALKRMIERPEYLFLMATQDGAAVGFSITIAFVDCDAALLEYMAVDASHPGMGVGQFLFRATTKYPPISQRSLLIEVDSDRTASAPTDDRTRRKHFYRRLGCRQIEGLTWIMPPVSSSQPPPMDMLLYRRELPDSIEKTRMRVWLEACYAQVYQQALPDARIESMLDGLPETISLL
jgi:ribosomal protein S18 acetylase RimI-like enzyme